MTPTSPGPRRIVWRKSSHSGSGDQCVEVAALGRHIAVRDSKNPAHVLVLSRPAFRTLSRK